MVHLKDSKPLDIARFTFSLGKLNHDKKKHVFSAYFLFILTSEDSNLIFLLSFAIIFWSGDLLLYFGTENKYVERNSWLGKLADFCVCFVATWGHGRSTGDYYSLLYVLVCICMMDKTIPVMRFTVTDCSG